MTKRNNKTKKHHKRIRRTPEPDGAKSNRLTRSVTFSLLPSDLEWLERTAETLKRATGGIQSFRSVLARESFLRMREELAGKSPQEILVYLKEQEIQRITREDNHSQLT